MDLDGLFKKLVEYGLVDPETFSPNFTERIMREGGGVKVIQNQDTDITANIKILAEGLEGCIQHYSPEKVEAFFYLQELANHARMLFYKCVKEETIESNESKKGFSEEERKSIIDRINSLSTGSYNAHEIGDSLGIREKSIGVFLSHLDDAKREKLRIKYTNEKKWEKY